MFDIQQTIVADGVTFRDIHSLGAWVVTCFYGTPYIRHIGCLRRTDHFDSCEGALRGELFHFSSIYIRMRQNSRAVGRYVRELAVGQSLSPKSVYVCFRQTKQLSVEKIFPCTYLETKIN